MTGKEFKDIREAMNLTQEELADVLGIKRITVLRWEKLLEIPKSKEMIIRSMYQKQTNRNIDVSKPDRGLENVADHIEIKEELIKLRGMIELVNQTVGKIALNLDDHRDRVEERFNSLINENKVGR